MIERLEATGLLLLSVATMLAAAVFLAGLIGLVEGF